MSAIPRIAIVHRSTAVSDDQARLWMAAWQRQIHEDFAPVWGRDADLVFVGTGDEPEPTDWQEVLLDTTDQAGALGYHELTKSGLPIGYVFVQEDLDAGYSPTVTGSHEGLEMLGDAWANALVQDRDRMVFYAFGEVGDAVEADDFGYDIDGVRVSDFCYPSYYDTASETPTGPFDKTEQLHSIVPAMAPGGYQAVFDPTSGWSQVTERQPGRVSHYRADTIRPYSRRARRRIPPAQRLRSLV